jgi:hypothetical protein
MNQLRNTATEILKPLDQVSDGLGSVLSVEVFAAEAIVLGAWCTRARPADRPRASNSVVVAPKLRTY